MTTFHPRPDDQGRAVLIRYPSAASPGMKSAGGALVLEPDGRAWAVAPSNRFGGHAFTLPKGRTDGRSLAATALVEVLEETGLRIRLDGFLCDMRRKETFTRFFLGTRLGGSPAMMGWESQGVVLAPMAALRALLRIPATRWCWMHSMEDGHGEVVVASHR